MSELEPPARGHIELYDKTNQEILRTWDDGVAAGELLRMLISMQRGRINGLEGYYLRAEPEPEPEPLATSSSVLAKRLQTYGKPGAPKHEPLLVLGSSFKHFVVIDPNILHITTPDESIRLPPKQIGLLRVLATYAGTVLERDLLMQSIAVPRLRTVDSHVSRMRARIGREYDDLVVGVRSVGYMGIRNFDSEEFFSQYH